MRMTCGQCATVFSAEVGAEGGVVQCSACGTYLEAPPQAAPMPSRPPPPPPMPQRAPIPSRTPPAPPRSPPLRAPVPPPAPPRAGARPSLVRTCPSCDETYDVQRSRCPSCGALSAKAQREIDAQAALVGPLSTAKRTVRHVMSKGVWGGIGLIAFAALWLVAGLMAGRLFVYPFILAVLGVVAIVDGMARTKALADRARRDAARRAERGERDSPRR